MKLILRYIKPFIPLVVIALLLLFAQTILELYLPNYMSSIVNVGIVQSGISNAAPEVMDADTMDMTLRFLSPEEQATVRSGYTWVDAGAASAKAAKTYPGLAEKGAYVRRDLDKDALSVLNDAVGKAYYVLSVAGGGVDFSKLSISETCALAAGLSEESVAMGQAMAEEANTALMRSVAITLTKVIHLEYGAAVARTQQGYILKIGGIMLLPLFVTMGFKEYDAEIYMSWDVWRPILCLAILCSSIAFTLWASTIKNLGVAKASIFLAMIPVVTAVIGALLGTELLTPLQWTGIAIAFFGLIMTQYVRKKR